MSCSKTFSFSPSLGQELGQESDLSPRLSLPPGHDPGLSYKDVVNYSKGEQGLRLKRFEEG